MINAPPKPTESQPNVAQPDPLHHVHPIRTCVAVWAALTILTFTTSAVLECCPPSRVDTVPCQHYMGGSTGLICQDAAC
jgi:hypothetical protein